MVNRGVFLYEMGGFFFWYIAGGFLLCTNLALASQIPTYDGPNGAVHGMMPRAHKTIRDIYGVILMVLTVVY